MQGWVGDIRIALRGLARTPRFTVLVLATLGLGIGSATAIFSAANEVMYRPLDFEDADRLVMVWERNQERGWEQVHAAPANVLDWRERVRAFSDVAWADESVSSVAMSSPAGAVQVDISKVSGNLFDVLGVRPALGRGFLWEDTWLAEAAESTIILSHSAWQQHFGGDAGVLGRTIHVDGRPRVVVGVMAQGFRYQLSDAEMWIPYLYDPGRRESVWFRQAHVVRAVARIGDGWTAEQARAQLEAVAAQLQTEYPALNRGMEAGFTPLHPYLVGDRRTPMLLLLGAVGLLLLIASANVANLFLVRGVGRDQEMAVRGALGAGRGRLGRQVMTESFVVAVLGAAVGVGVGVIFLEWIARLAPRELAVTGFTLDARVAMATIAVTAVTALLFGFVPALRGSRTDLAGVLGGGGRNRSLSGLSLRVSYWIVAGEIAVALTLVGGAGLMYRSLQELSEVELGVDPTNVLTFEIRAASGSYATGSDRVDMVHRFLEEVRAIPGVTHAGVNRGLPLQGNQWSSDFSMDGWGPDRFGTEVRHREATPGYFAAMKIPTVAGSLFAERPDENLPVPVVVNQAFVDQYFPEQTPVGRSISFNRHPDETSYWYRVVGVVGNERLQAISPPTPEIISHIGGDSPRLMRVAVRTAVPPLSLTGEIQKAMDAIDPEIPVVKIRSMEQLARQALATDRFLLALFGAFAVAALILAAVGVYGVSEQVARAQLREIGIKVALGASEHRVVSDLTRRAGVYVGAGIVLGLGGALLGGKAMEGLLFQVEPADPGTLVLVALLLGTVATAATYWPALKAGRADPASVLRQDS